DPDRAPAEFVRHVGDERDEPFVDEHLMTRTPRRERDRERLPRDGEHLALRSDEVTAPALAVAGNRNVSAPPRLVSVGPPRGVRRQWTNGASLESPLAVRTLAVRFFARPRFEARHGLGAPGDSRRVSGLLEGDDHVVGTLLPRTALFAGPGRGVHRSFVATA